MLANRGWTVGRNLEIDYRWVPGNDTEKTRVAIEDLLSLGPDLMIGNGSRVLNPMREATRTVPLVFVFVSEPVAQGFVQSLSHPGGNVTGFTHLEPSVGAKWLELLKEVAPGVTRVAFVFNPENSGTKLYFASVSAAAQKFRVEATTLPVRSVEDLESALTLHGREPGGGLVLPPDSFTNSHRKLIVELTARHRLPTIYERRFFAEEGGLMSYGINLVDEFRQAATYVDRILRGEKPADLPVQQPTTFELVINLKTAKALGLAVPPTLLAQADDVIE
jgi:putative ABC transport system substrate-binding protein